MRDRDTLAGGAGQVEANIGGCNIQIWGNCAVNMGQLLSDARDQENKLFYRELMGKQILN